MSHPLEKKPLAKAPARPVSSLCGMGDHADCSGWTPKDGRGRLVRCACERCRHVEARSA